MKTVFLKNGQEADLIENLNGKFLVDPHNVYYGYERDEYTCASGQLQIVDEIFSKPPIEKVNQQFIEILNKIEAKTKVLIDLEKEISTSSSKLNTVKLDFDNIVKWQVDLSKFKNAKNIVFFKPKYLMPVIINKENLKSSYNFDSGIRLKFFVEARNGEVTTDFIKFDWEGRDGYNSEKIDETYGIMINLNDEQILEITRERNSNLDPSEYYYDTLKGMDEKYMTPNFIERREQSKKQQMDKKINDLKIEIENKKAELKELTK